MQNQLTYSNQVTPPQPPNSLNPSKFTSPTHPKSFDKTLPTMNLKHYSSNPNLSLDVNGMKTSGIMNESNAFPTAVNKKSI